MFPLFGCQRTKFLGDRAYIYAFELNLLPISSPLLKPTYKTKNLLSHPRGCAATLPRAAGKGLKTGCD